MKCTIKSAITALCLTPWGLTQAVDLNDNLNIDLNIGVYSDYRTRGVSQTQNDPAVQGSATLTHSSGLYAGAWSSNVDYGYDSSTRQEIDYYAGYYWQISDDISLDVAYYKYEYPREASLNNNESHAQISAYGFNIGGNYSDNLGGDDSFLYSYVGYETILPMNTGLNLRYGLVDYKDPSFYKSEEDTGRNKYREWSATLSKTLLELDWTVSFIDTDLSKDECYSYNGFDDVCSATLVLGASKSF